LPARVSNFPGDGLGGGEGQIARGNRRTLAREHRGTRGADPGAGAGDQNNFSFEAAKRSGGHRLDLSGVSRTTKVNPAGWAAVAQSWNCRSGFTPREIMSGLRDGFLAA